jgi:hypothetical protein
MIGSGTLGLKHLVFFQLILPRLRRFFYTSKGIHTAEYVAKKSTPPPFPTRSSIRFTQSTSTSLYVFTHQKIYV